MLTDQNVAYRTSISTGCKVHQPWRVGRVQNTWQTEEMMGYVMPGIGQVEQRRSIHGWRETGNTGERGTRSDLWPPAIRTETRK